MKYSLQVTEPVLHNLLIVLWNRLQIDLEIIKRKKFTKC